MRDLMQKGAFPLPTTTQQHREVLQTALGSSSKTSRNKMSFAASLVSRRGSLLARGSLSPSSVRVSQSLFSVLAGPDSSKGGFGIGNVESKMLPSCNDTNLWKHCKYPRTATIIGAPMTYGQPYVGTDSGPTLLRERGLLSMLTSLGWRIEDLPDLEFDPTDEIGAGMKDPPNARNCALVGRAASLLADTVEDSIYKGRFPVVLGGDHSIGIGSLTGILRARPNVGVIWVDAHADLNTPATSGSGNMHGMPVGLLMDHPTEKTDFTKLPGFDFLVDGPRLKPEQIVYIGLRDVDPSEREWIRDLGIKAFTMYDIDHYGIGSVMDQTFEHLLKDDPDRPVHLSYDIDAVDPDHAPATGTTVRGGLTYREAHFVAEYVAQSGNLASAEVVEVNPTLSHGAGGDETLDLGLGLITSFMGQSIL